jgi:hypothetical protein
MFKRSIPVLFIICALGVFSASASAETEGPGWELTARTYPTYLPPDGRGVIDVDVFNVGAGAAGCTGAQYSKEKEEKQTFGNPLCPEKSPATNPIAVTDTLPPGVTAIEEGELNGAPNVNAPEIGHERWNCIGNRPGGLVEGATVVTCTSDTEGVRGGFGGGGGAPTGGHVELNQPNIQPRIGIAVRAGTEASGLSNDVTIAGGGAPNPASTTEPITISAKKPPFGFVGWDGWFSNADGTLDTQAGSHPYELTLAYTLASEVQGEELAPAGGEARDLEVRLPPGIIGDTTAVPQCGRQQLENETCPGSSIIGTDSVYFSVSSGAAAKGFAVFNMVPPPGVAAEFGFSYNGILVFLDSTVRTGGDYGITTHVNQVPQKLIGTNILTLWNVPGEASHDLWRLGEIGGCPLSQISPPPGTTPEGFEQYCVAPYAPVLKPLLTVPTSCGQEEPIVIRADAWQDTSITSEAKFDLHDSNGAPTGFTGCEDLGFGPLISTAPDTSESDTPAGLTVEVKPPLGGLQEPGQLGTSDIQDTTVTLPEGFVVNPGQAAGLQACQPSQDGLTTEAERAEGSENDGPAACPSASKIGTVMIKTPLLEGVSEKQLEGSVYILQSNPPELKLLLAASADGVNLKLVGTVHLDEHTGRLTTTFQGTPQLPFTSFKLSFSGGAQAALDTPTQCGTYPSSADFTPWASPLISDFPASASFSITAGPGGGGCSSNPLPFSPSLTAGSSTDKAGAYTGFSMLLQRGDGQQRIERLQFKIPAGLVGMISSVPLCQEPLAAQGACPTSSHIGHTVVASGPGAYPLVIPQPGEPEAGIFLTGPYEGAPFGLSIVTPVIAGPFNLGTIVTRAKIEVDPSTAQITVTTDPLPQVVKGVPTDLRQVQAVIDRPGFMLNPTNCNPQEFTGTAWGAPPPGVGGPGSSASISSQFGIGSCRELAFAPKFSVSTPGRTGKADGAGLTAKLSYPAGSLGTQTNITRVKVDLPKQLPSRLTTLQKACTSAQFAANPAGCPPASIIGHATVTTPVLSVPLTGPAYFVSHGGEAFPSLTIVLQGDNVMVELVGTTFISRAGITSTTFKTVPDVPFNTFTLTLPQGKYSALAANVPAKDHYSLCGQKLTMPTEFLAQNGAKINQSTPLSVSGCAKAKTLTRAQKLTAALKACHKQAKGKRAGCEGAARRKYGPVKVKGKKK